MVGGGRTGGSAGAGEQGQGAAGVGALVRWELAPFLCIVAPSCCSQDYEVDDLIDVIEGSRVYIPCIYAVNKIDQVGAARV